MREIDLEEAAIGLAELLDQVERGQEFTIMADGRARARLAPPDRNIRDGRDVRAAIQRMIEASTRQPARLDARELWDAGQRY